jgi:hypothetical protein
LPPSCAWKAHPCTIASTRQRMATCSVHGIFRWLLPRSTIRSRCLKEVHRPTGRYACPDGIIHGKEPAFRLRRRP